MTINRNFGNTIIDICICIYTFAFSISLSIKLLNIIYLQFSHATLSFYCGVSKWYEWTFELGYTCNLLTQYILIFLETTLSSGSSTTFTRSPPLSRKKIDLTSFYGPAFSDKEREIMFNDNHMYDYYITQSTFVCSWTASLIDYFNDMNVLCCSL